MRTEGRRRKVLFRPLPSALCPLPSALAAIKTKIIILKAISPGGLLPFAFGSHGRRRRSFHQGLFQMHDVFLHQQDVIAMGEVLQVTQP